MDQDTRFQMHLLTSTTAAAIKYFRVPYKCTVRDLKVTVQADPGDAETVTLESGGATIGVVTLGTDIAAGAYADVVKDASEGDTVLAKNDLLTLTASQVTAVADYVLDLELDPKARAV